MRAFKSKSSKKHPARYCVYCEKEIDQYNSSVKWAMIITIRGQKIVAFECFHGECWEAFNLT